MAIHTGKVLEVSSDELRRRLDAGDTERRVDTRVPARLQIELPLPTVEQLRRLYTDNISQDGLMFTVKLPVTLPAEVELTLMLPDARTITLNSEIRHAARRESSDEIEVGVQFKGLDPAVRAQLEQTIAALDAPHA